MDVSVACRIFSLTNADLFDTFFPENPQKQAIASYIREVATAFKILQSRVVEDKKDKMKCAYRFYLREQEQALDRFVETLEKIIWYSRDGPAPGKSAVGTNGGPRCWNQYFHFPKGAKLTVTSTKELHKDLKV